MTKTIIQPAIEFEVTEIEGGNVVCELSCTSCSGMKVEINPESLEGKEEIACTACGAVVRLKAAIEASMVDA